MDVCISCDHWFFWWAQSFLPKQASAHQLLPANYSPGLVSLSVYSLKSSLGVVHCPQVVPRYTWDAGTKATACAMTTADLLATIQLCRPPYWVSCHLELVSVRIYIWKSVLSCCLLYKCSYGFVVLAARLLNVQWQATTHTLLFASPASAFWIMMCPVSADPANAVASCESECQWYWGDFARVLEQPQQGKLKT